MKPAATLAVRLLAWHEDGALVDAERERALALHLETGKQ